MIKIITFMNVGGSPCNIFITLGHGGCNKMLKCFYIILKNYDLLDAVPMGQETLRALDPKCTCNLMTCSSMNIWELLYSPHLQVKNLSDGTEIM